MSNGTSRFGTGFALLTLLLMGILFYFYVSGYFEKGRNPNQRVEVLNDGDRSLVLKQSYDGHYRVSGLINGHPVVFFIDTGSSDIALNEELANEIGLRKGHQGKAYTANGVTEQWSTVIDEINIGGLVMDDVRASILPNMDDEVLLGMDYLRHFHWRQEQGELVLTPIQ
ncbi:TIGR02281 family clan AA aspartic protease [Cardiobacteriaceae bacterium TAE3-ERU3]|nr:TIGR02281 family clan AA aspartic protease [Cardiobacteriaceae bacterium TAE3-ERU3]